MSRLAALEEPHHRVKRAELDSMMVRMDSLEARLAANRNELLAVVDKTEDHLSDSVANEAKTEEQRITTLMETINVFAAGLAKHFECDEFKDGILQQIDGEMIR